jgi:hypothetical protein
MLTAHRRQYPVAPGVDCSRSFSTSRTSDISMPLPARHNPVSGIGPGGVRIMGSDRRWVTGAAVDAVWLFR